MNYNQFVYRIIFVLLLIFLTSVNCDNSKEIRSYTENISDNKIEKKDQKEPAGKSLSLKWDTPKGWVEQQGSGFRLATFVIKSENKEAVCTIIPLMGDGGGLELNVLRWLNQLKIVMDSEEDLKKFISEQKKYKTSGGLEAVLVDFTTLSNSNTGNSMVVAVITLKKSTLFIKMKGERSFVIKNRNDFISLFKSIKNRF